MYDICVLQSCVGVWALDMKDAVCIAVNHRYRQIVYGCAR